MAGFSTYLSDAILNWVKSTAFPADPANVYAALWDGDPLDDASGGTEVTTTIDATGRKAITFGAIAGKTISNTADVDFGLADAGADVTHVAIFDAAAAGNMLYSYPLASARTFIAGDPVNFPAGFFNVTHDLNL